ncbi:unnamed protein product [Mytilus coruscus]|uniref:Uncharacterized protein n=1 Tax=Mytilus coruscus TaxID=42192 RepID=A0A6J8E2J3_MYTCO|nr:unnamed protein product [Mytilus coruscus]
MERNASLKCKYGPNTKKIEIGPTAIIDMKILPGVGIVVADYNKRLIVWDVNQPGIQKSEIDLEAKPYGLAVVGENTIAVSVGHKSIQVLDVSNEQVLQTIDVVPKTIEKPRTHSQSSRNSRSEQEVTELQPITYNNSEVRLWGLEYYAGKFYIAAKDRIVVINETSSPFENIIKIPNSWIFYLQIHEEKIFFTNYNASSFVCATISGDIVFEVNSSLKGPYGFERITRNTFMVTDWVANKLYKIKKDGKHTDAVLSKVDGIFKPRAILYVRENGMLLIACDGGKSLLQRKCRESFILDKT